MGPQPLKSELLPVDYSAGRRSGRSLRRTVPPFSTRTDALAVHRYQFLGCSVRIHFNYVNLPESTNCVPLMFTAPKTR